MNGICLIFFAAAACIAGASAERELTEAEIAGTGVLPAIIAKFLAPDAFFAYEATWRDVPLAQQLTPLYLTRRKRLFAAIALSAATASIEHEYAPLAETSAIVERTRRHPFFDPRAFKLDMDMHVKIKYAVDKLLPRITELFAPIRGAVYSAKLVKQRRHTGPRQREYGCRLIVRIHEAMLSYSPMPESVYAASRLEDFLAEAIAAKSVALETVPTDNFAALYRGAPHRACYAMKETRGNAEDASGANVAAISSRASRRFAAPLATWLDARLRQRDALPMRVAAALQVGIIHYDPLGGARRVESACVFALSDALDGQRNAGSLFERLL